MKKFVILFVMVLAGLLLTIAARAEGPMSPWQFFAEIRAAASAAGVYRLVVPLQVMDQAREDLTDLRLVDTTGREIPYALRVRKEVNEQREFGTRLFNQVTTGNTSEISVDVGNNPTEHNEIEIETSGTNFRRRVDVEGSDDGSGWKTLRTGAQIFQFAAQNRVANSDHVSYPLSRYRFLRLRIHADELTDKSPPEVSVVKVLMVAREPGSLTSWNIDPPSPQFLRNQGVPTSAWTIDLGARVPCDRLELTIDNESFSRQFQLEVTDDPENRRLVASGELARRIGEAQQPLTISLDEEVYARKLRLLVSDYSNQPLSLSAIKAGAPARELYFELKQPATEPLRLYFGNPNSIPPHYDFEKELVAKLSSAPATATVGPGVSNPDYQPAPLPFTERVPWLIYVVLTISSLALGWILFSLARKTMRMDEEAKMDVPPEPGKG